MATDAVNRSIIAQLRGCEDDTPLSGTACTNSCSLRNTCKIRRVSLLIHTNVVKAEGDILDVEDNHIFGISVPIHTISPDEYLNEIIGMVTNESVSKHKKNMTYR